MIWGSFVYILLYNKRMASNTLIDPKIFKAYDIRGKYPKEINERAVFKIAKKLPKLLGRKIVVAHDARLSSPKLYRAAIKGIKYQVSGIRIIEAGLATTPMFYFLVNKLKADGGIMVTASHNPKEYNGLKVVGKYARPISGYDIYELYK